MSKNLTFPVDHHIPHPEMWTLLLAVQRQALRYILYTDMQADSLVTGEISLEAGGDWQKSVENAVYDNPTLLDDYGCVRLLVETPSFMFLPSQGDDDDLVEQMLREQFPDMDGVCTVSDLPLCGVRMAFSVADELQGFLQRTFNMAPIYHQLYPLCEHYARFCANSSVRRMFLHFHHQSMDVVAFDRSRLLMANTFSVRNSEDAQFMALHAWKSLSMDAHSDELQFAGDRTMCQQVAPTLRQYVSYVMPTMFPAAAMRLGHDAVRAPLNLITLALCE